jgi:hypothetical protein
MELSMHRKCLGGGGTLKGMHMSLREWNYLRAGKVSTECLNTEF